MLRAAKQSDILFPVLVQGHVGTGANEINCFLEASRGDTWRNVQKQRLLLHGRKDGQVRKQLLLFFCYLEVAGGATDKIKLI